MPIKFSLSSTEPLSVAADVLVLGVPEGSTMKEGALGELSKALGPSMAKAVKREEFTGKKDQTLDISTGGTDLKPGRVLLVGLGKPEALTAVDVRVMAAKSARFALGAKATTFALELPVIAGAERAAAEGVVLGAYRFTRYLTGDRVPKYAIERATLIAPGKVGQGAEGRGGPRPGRRGGRLHRPGPHQRAAERAHPRGAREPRRRRGEEARARGHRARQGRPPEEGDEAHPRGGRRQRAPAPARAHGLQNLRAPGRRSSCSWARG